MSCGGGEDYVLIWAWIRVSLAGVTSTNLRNSMRDRSFSKEEREVLVCRVGWTNQRSPKSVSLRLNSHHVQYDIVPLMLFRVTLLHLFVSLGTSVALEYKFHLFLLAGFLLLRCNLR